ncbi:hypothetical protein ACQ4PT_067966 [Festuca glaucescens]
MGGGAGAAEPLLLPELSGGHGGGASVSGAVFNLSTSIIGAGIMSIPAAMRVLGVAPTLVLIAAVAVLSDVSRGVHAAVHGLGAQRPALVRGGHGRRVRPRRRRRAQRLRRLHHRRHPRRLPHHHRGRVVRERGGRRGARRGAGGVVRRAVVDRKGVRDTGDDRRCSAAARAPPPRRFVQSM